jgi:hypothetical protein
MTPDHESNVATLAIDADTRATRVLIAIRLLSDLAAEAGALECVCDGCAACSIADDASAIEAATGPLERLIDGWADHDEGQVEAAADRLREALDGQSCGPGWRRPRPDPDAGA